MPKARRKDDNIVPGGRLRHQARVNVDSIECTAAWTVMDVTRRKKEQARICQPCQTLVQGQSRCGGAEMATRTLSQTHQEPLMPRRGAKRGNVKLSWGTSSKSSFPSALARHTAQAKRSRPPLPRPSHATSPTVEATPCVDKIELGPA